MKKALIVDDDSSVRNLLCSVLVGDYEVTESATRGEALAFCEKNIYDLVCLDHNLPDGTGWEIAEMIRKDSSRYGCPKIIAMSGSVSSDDGISSNQFFDLFLEKPFEIQDVIDISKG